MRNADKKRIFLGHLRDLLIVIIIGNLITSLFGASIDYIFSFQASAYSLLIGGFLWKGNQTIGYFVNKHVNMHEEPARALRWNLFAMFSYSVIIIFLVNFFWHVILYKIEVRHLFQGSGRLVMIVELGITIVIISILYSIDFFRSWREAAVNEEKLKRESIALQYKALKNQVNPHFLFNSLNTLSTLVYKDQDLATKFIKQLSEVYRYLLEQKDNEVVAVKTEIEFVEKYLYLQKIRHGDNLKTNIDLRGCSDKLIIPLSLQMLVENAVKHNIVSKDDPLEIKIFNDKDYIIVRNHLQKKTTIGHSGGIGLNNIKSRYEYFTNKSFIIEETSSHFIVKVPLIKSGEA